MAKIPVMTSFFYKFKLHSLGKLLWHTVTGDRIISNLMNRRLHIVSVYSEAPERDAHTLGWWKRNQSAMLCYYPGCRGAALGQLLYCSGSWSNSYQLFTCKCADLFGLSFTMHCHAMLYEENIIKADKQLPWRPTVYIASAFWWRRGFRTLSRLEDDSSRLLQ